MENKLDCSQIGYYGRAANTLSRDELLEMVAEMATLMRARGLMSDKNESISSTGKAAKMTKVINDT